LKPKGASLNTKWWGVKTKCDTRDYAEGWGCGEKETEREFPSQRANEPTAA